MKEGPDQDREFLQQIERDTSRLKQAEKDRSTILAQTAYIGVLGLLLVVPIVEGAYLGHWIDSMQEGYAMRWTLSLLILGVFVGAYNVYRFIRERE